MTDPATPKPRGRPTTGRARTPAQRMADMRARAREALTDPGLHAADLPDSGVLEMVRSSYARRLPALLREAADELLRRLGHVVAVTVTGNPEHRALFTIPTPVVSDSTALAIARPLPKQERVTGDLEVDAALWLRQICQSAMDMATLDKALEGAKKITTPAKELEDRYAKFMQAQGAHPMQAVFGSFDMANIERHVEHARKRIEWNAVAMAVFGTYEAVMAPTPPEQMLQRSTPARLPKADSWQWTPEQMTKVFARAVNPSTLSEAVAEIRYWHWLYDVRRHAHQTRYPGDYFGDEDFLVQAHGEYAERLLRELPPVDRAEAVAVAAALDELGLDQERQIPILMHLVG